MKVGDIVKPINGRLAHIVLHADAVVVSVTPFVLVSREADMRWSATVKPENFKVVGHASTEVTNRCLRQL